MFTHPLITTLKNLKGNARGVVLTEPLWGIPFNLYAPYVSVYMRALGLQDNQIGLIISVGMFFQILSSLLSGIVTDKLGRKRTTLIFDTLSWSIPCLIWAVAQNFTYFIVAAIINSLWRVTMNSWTCLLVEDTDPGLLVKIYTMIYISGLLVAFFAPLAGLFIKFFTLVPTMRGLYLFAFILMTTKFIVMNALVSETRQGQVRMRETSGQNFFAMFGEYRSVIGLILRTPATLYTVGIMLVMSTCTLINNTFWAILVTERIQLPAQDLALYAFARSITMLLLFLFVVPRLGEMHFKIPLMAGFACFVVGQLTLIATPVGNYAWLLISTLLEACSLATVNPLIDRMIVITVNPQERARIMAILYVVMIAITTPFGWIAGSLSEVNRILPFLLNIIFYTLGGLLAFLAARAAVKPAEVPEVVGVA
jgi:DHA1 family tetracycline resistance protein-like MFS transporter